MSKQNLHTNVYSIFIHDCKNYKQLRCPLTSERINELWHIYIMEYDSVIKRNTPSNHKNMNMTFKYILLSERIQFIEAT